MLIRKAQDRDLQELLYIYNYEVLNGTATLDLAERTIEQQQIWLKAHNILNHPLIVAVIDGKIAGYASLSTYREKDAYFTTVELSVYVHPDFRRMGVATTLMEHIIGIAREDETIHTIVSVITAGNEVSIKLHERFGFEYCGKIRKVAVKFGKFLDIENYQLMV